MIDRGFLGDMREPGRIKANNKAVAESKESSDGLLHSNIFVCDYQDSTDHP